MAFCFPHRTYLFFLEVLSVALTPLVLAVSVRRSLPAAVAAMRAATVAVPGMGAMPAAAAARGDPETEGEEQEQSGDSGVSDSDWDSDSDDDSDSDSESDGGRADKIGSMQAMMFAQHGPNGMFYSNPGNVRLRSHGRG